MQYLVKEFKRTEKVKAEKDAVAMQRIREAAEKAKKELSQLSETNVNLPFYGMARVAQNIWI